MPPADAEAVLVTGVYGAGKSTVVADIGGMLERRGEHYGVLDVDWLGWFDAGLDLEARRRVLLADVRAVCGVRGPDRGAPRGRPAGGPEWLSAGRGAGLADLVLLGDRPVRRTSEAICSWLGWI
jgi:hypothetical protein